VAYLKSLECLCVKGGSGSLNANAGVIKAKSSTSLANIKAKVIAAGSICSTSSLFGKIISVTINHGGTGYVSGDCAPYLTVTGGGGTGAILEAVVTDGVITGVNVINPGSGYTSAPTITIGPNPLLSCLVFPGTGAEIVAVVGSVADVGSCIAPSMIRLRTSPANLSGVASISSKLSVSGAMSRGSTFCSRFT